MINVKFRSGVQARRILFVTHKLALRSGGAERVLIETANALASRGHIVELASHEYRGKPPFYPLGPGVFHSNLRPPLRGFRRRLHNLREAAQEKAPDVFPLDRLVWASRNLGFVRRLEAHIDATKPDIVVAFMPPALTALGRVRKRPGTKYMASLHNVPEQDFDSPLRWDPSAFDRRLRSEALSKMSGITVLLPEFIDWFPTEIQPKLHLMPNAIKPIQAQLTIDRPRDKVVLAVGRLADVKRHDLLLDAWAKINSLFPDWKLEIYGEGPRKADLTAQIEKLGISNSAKLMGHIAAIEDKYLSASILAHPAEYEGFGLAPAEALAAGMPVIGFSDCSGVNFLVQDGISGLLVDGERSREERVANFAVALKRLMTDPLERASLGAAGPRAMARFAPDEILAKWERFLFGPEASSGTLIDNH